MNPLRRILINRKLRKSLKPNPKLRDKRMVQLSPERRERYRKNIVEIWG